MLLKWFIYVVRWKKCVIFLCKKYLWGKFILTFWNQLILTLPQRMRHAYWVWIEQATTKQVKRTALLWRHGRRTCALQCLVLFVVLWSWVLCWLTVQGIWQIKRIFFFYFERTIWLLVVAVPKNKNWTIRQVYHLATALRRWLMGLMEYLMEW